MQEPKPTRMVTIRYGIYHYDEITFGFMSPVEIPVGASLVLFPEDTMSYSPPTYLPEADAPHNTKG
jgi:hypothetical protein